MIYPQIKLLIEGPDEGDGHIVLAEFIRKLQLFSGALKESDRQISPHGEPASIFRVIGLSYSSPATVVVQAEPRDPEYDLSEEVLTHFFGVIRDIETKGTTSRDASVGLLANLRDMTASVGGTVAAVKVTRNGETVDLGTRFGRRVRDLLEPQETYPGAMRGMLEAINLHRDANVFRLYPDIGPAKVTCHFPAPLQQAAIAGVGRFVEVRGVLKYNVTSRYPYEVDVTGIEVFPPSEDLPSLYQLRGAAPGATGGLSSDQFVRKLRDAAT
jgi:hypothetical protein